jgi:hypothetical protein
MVKAKEFWNFLCDKLDYRIFSGVPCLGLKSFYDNMDPKIMLYLPAVNENTAVGIAAGAWSSGTKAGIIVDHRYLTRVAYWLDYCIKNKTHLAIITNGDVNLKVPKVVLKDNNYDVLEKELSKASKKSVPLLIIIERD